MERRKYANAYSMSSLIAYEPFVDTCSGRLHSTLSKFASSGERINMQYWLQCYAFETVSMITVKLALKPFRRSGR